MRRVAAVERRALLVHRHRFDGGAPDAEAVVAAVLALHATDPASVVLSVLARSAAARIEDVTAAFQDGRSLVRWMAMRRTLFAFLADDVPLVQAAIGDPLAATMRRRLLSRIERNGVDPAPDGDADAWLRRAEEAVLVALARLGPSSGGEIRRHVEALRAVIRARAASEAPQALTSPLLTLMGTEGRIVRASPIGAWTTRTHRWALAADWWPEGLPDVDAAAARVGLARRWLERFGPATEADLQWWAGWSKGTTRAALTGLEVEAVDLDGEPGIDLPRDEVAPVAAPQAVLLPALDPTPMGWQRRAWFTPVDPSPLYDRNGNLGPTVWWDGEIVGGWSAATGTVRTALLVDRGQEAAAAVETAAAVLEARLEGAVVLPVFPTALARRLER